MVVVLPAPVTSLLPKVSPAEPVMGAVMMRVRLPSLLKIFPGAATEIDPASVKVKVSACPMPPPLSTRLLTVTVRLAEPLRVRTPPVSMESESPWKMTSVPVPGVRRPNAPVK